MAKRSLILSSISAKGDKLSKTVTVVNPLANETVLKTFAQKLNALTTNTYSKTDCIDKYNVDTEKVPGADSRQVPTLTVESIPTLAQVRAGNAPFPKIVTESDGDWYVYAKSGLIFIAISIANYEGKRFCLNVTPGSSADQTTGGVLVIGVKGTETYQPAEIEYTLE